MRKILCFFALLFVTILFSGKNVYATDGTPTVDSILNETSTENTSENSEVTETTESSSENSSEISETTTEENLENLDPMDYINNQFPSHTLDEVGGKMMVKGGEVLQLVQIVGYIIVSIVFIVAVIILAVNKATGNGHSSGVGIGALIICGICYVLIFLGPSILEWLKTWVVS